jgi:hypothetical protein
MSKIGYLDAVKVFAGLNKKLNINMANSIKAKVINDNLREERAKPDNET